LLLQTSGLFPEHKHCFFHDLSFRNTQTALPLNFETSETSHWQDTSQGARRGGWEPAAMASNMATWEILLHPKIGIFMDFPLPPLITRG
jgi:hypothetical protein